ncbi:hypothetical protein M406DRAFT_69389 [Cryphonectria parasitica EP155]|uniref:Uncharacterized protein n=1 Tax=Cryphonectria parasitica (strain ATCC 38755 / EP155) TaxID=660469 RepID=A0A9P4Y5C6_CRYP1|nr:uncharacterized protein M406DRAFT_69389 [Cryphonectria parasitica EP155]KAF3767227.1 hypothetical protein M406DRAFT_69389 [Cryphonectria parasitica EP155]
MEEDRLGVAWFTNFHAWRPPQFAREHASWNTKSLDLNDMAHLKLVLFRDQVLIVIGGKVGLPRTVYQSEDDLRRFFEDTSTIRYDRDIQMGHVVDYFVGRDGAAVYNFPAIDAAESLTERENGLCKVSRGIKVSQDELASRAVNLIKDPIFQVADALIINQDFAFSISDDAPFDSFVEDLYNRRQQSTDAVLAICDAIRALPNRRRKDMKIIVLQNSSTWPSHSGAEAARGKDGHLTPSAESQTKEAAYCKDLRDSVGIELSFVMNAVVPHMKPSVDDNWRVTLNCFSRRGFSNWEKRQIGIDLARRVAFGENGPTPEQKEELYDKVLEQFLRSRMLFRQYSLSEILLWNREQMLRSFTSSRKVSCPPQIETPARIILEPPPEIVEGTITEQEMGNDVESAMELTANPPPALAGKVALILDSGRGDGVTEATCLELARLGAKVGVTYVPSVQGCEMALRVVQEIRRNGGKAQKVPGIPFRSKNYSYPDGGDDTNYIHELLGLLVDSLQVSQIDIIVNNTGWRYDLAGDTPEHHDEMLHLMSRDGTRNLLALTYTVEHCVEYKLLGEGARIINIAGMIVNPATHMNGAPHGTYLFSFMDRWSYQLLNASPHMDEDDPFVQFSTIIPGFVMDDAIRPTNEKAREDWWANLGTMHVLWKDPETVQETAKIIGLLALPEFAEENIAIAPDHEFVPPRPVGPSLGESGEGANDRHGGGHGPNSWVMGGATSASKTVRFANS